MSDTIFQAGNNKKYLILTAKQKEMFLITINYLDAYEFIVRNSDTKIRTIDYTAKTTVYHRDLFLTDFLSRSDDKEKFFRLVRTMIKGDTNIHVFLKKLGLVDEFRQSEKLNALNL